LRQIGFDEFCETHGPYSLSIKDAGSGGRPKQQCIAKPCGSSAARRARAELGHRSDRSCLRLQLHLLTDDRFSRQAK
jgi:hypothetical protein